MSVVKKVRDISKHRAPKTTMKPRGRITAYKAFKERCRVNVRNGMTNRPDGHWVVASKSDK